MLEAATKTYELYQLHKIAVAFQQRFNILDQTHPAPTRPLLTQLTIDNSLNGYLDYLR